MGYIICIASLKGGVGKTTTAVNLSASFAAMGKKTLLIDCDPQGSATTGIGLRKKKFTHTLYDAMGGDISAEKVILNTDIKLLHAIPVCGEFFRAELELMSRPEKEKVLHQLLSPLKKNYDYLIIDTPPSLGLLSINAMTAADTLLIPLQCEFLAYESFIQLLRFAKIVRKKLNPGLKLAGILLTMYEMGERVSQEIAQNVQNHLKTYVFETVIPRSSQIRELSGTGKPLLLADPQSVGAKSYMKLAEEILEQEKKDKD